MIMLNYSYDTIHLFLDNSQVVKKLKYRVLNKILCISLLRWLLNAEISTESNIFAAKNSETSSFYSFKHNNQDFVYGIMLNKCV